MFKIIYIVIAAVTSFVVALLFFGCATAGAGVNGDVLNHQQQIDRLEEELRTRDRTVETAIRELGSITVRSSAVEGTVDEIIELFAEYQRRVEKLIRDYNTIRAATRADGESVAGNVSDTSSDDTR